MNDFQLLASPLLVNLLIFVPVFLFWFFWKQKLAITKKQLLISALFGIAFGFVEASVVVYLRAALGLQSAVDYQQIQILSNLPSGLLIVEICREIATIIMLVSVALLVAKKPKEQFAFFLWAFAFWDIFYYVGLWLTVGWPSSLTTGDVLFLIPVPWLAQVWFPLLVSGLTILAIALNRRDPE